MSCLSFSSLISWSFASICILHACNSSRDLINFINGVNNDFELKKQHKSYELIKEFINLLEKLNNKMKNLHSSTYYRYCVGEECKSDFNVDTGVTYTSYEFTNNYFKKKLTNTQIKNIDIEKYIKLYNDNIVSSPFCMLILLIDFDATYDNVIGYSDPNVVFQSKKIEYQNFAETFMQTFTIDRFFDKLDEIKSKLLEANNG
jgi:hypothetical protein